MTRIGHVNVIRVVVLTGLALMAFAANSVLCRLALGTGSIDAASFTVARLLSGSLTLVVVLFLRSERSLIPKYGSWMSSWMLFIYAISFSYAYITLETGTGALILFGAVQITMILTAVLTGTQLKSSEWIGVGVAFGGFVYLVMPGVSTPSLLGFSLMLISGIAWGIYTLRGRGSERPLLDTAHNFMRTVPLLVILFLSTRFEMNYSTQGLIYAVLSGALASGVGYSIWYAALKHLSASQAAVLQLLVPVIAAMGGVLFVGERITPRLIVSALMVLGGIFLVILGQYEYGGGKQISDDNVDESG